ncbi:phytanoyl-CoA dioxygenase family protein [Bradyrhizobium betae]|uniref:phytanoyl-CoA dioxygenase family protein n=1 Tax=Bradyrhizobium betae TaxID=244734 RepID=UPI003D66984C
MYKIAFDINDNTKDKAARIRSVDVLASVDEVEHLVREGWLQIDGLFSDVELQSFRQAIEEVVTAETDNPTTEHIPGNGHYIRSLLDKHSAFHSLIRMKRPLSIARAVLGPQVWFDAEARVVPAGIAGMRVNWHIHHRVIPAPLPPFFCYPHAVHGLIYLDDVNEDTGPIRILPGSHMQPHLDISNTDGEPRTAQVTLLPKAGTCLLMHANTWHSTVPTTRNAGRRRLLLFGYTPSWIRPDVARGVKPAATLTDELRKFGDAEMRELLGEYFW